MTEIWKFPLTPNHPDITMPQGATIISAAAQGDTICVWAIVEPANPPEERAVVAIATGYDPGLANGTDGLVFIGTALLHDGALVYHVFEVTTDRYKEQT